MTDHDTKGQFPSLTNATK